VRQSDRREAGRRRYRSGPCREWLKTKCAETSEFVTIGNREAAPGEIEAVRIRQTARAYVVFLWMALFSDQSGRRAPQRRQLNSFSGVWKRRPPVVDGVFPARESYGDGTSKTVFPGKEAFLR
jgi:hypothetical protein